MKVILKFVIIILFISFVSVPCYATDVSLPEVDYGEYADDPDGDYNLFAKAWEIITDRLSVVVDRLLPHASGIVAILVLASLIGNAVGDGHAMASACELLSMIALAGAVYSLIGGAVDLVCVAIDALCTFVASYLPVMATLYCMGGNPLAASASTSGLMLFLSIMQTLESKFFVPLFRLSLAVMISSALPSSVDLRSVWSFIKSSLTTLLVFLFSSLNFVLGLGTLFSAGKDTFALRTVRFAGGNFIPVIGSLLGEASKTVFSSAASIKAVSGTGAIVALMSIVLPPIVVLLAYKLAILFCAAMARLLGRERESGFLYDVNGLLGVLLGLVCGSASVFVIATGLFVSINGGASA